MDITVILDKKHKHVTLVNSTIYILYIIFLTEMRYSVVLDGSGIVWNG